LKGGETRIAEQAPADRRNRYRRDVQVGERRRRVVRLRVIGCILIAGAPERLGHLPDRKAQAPHRPVGHQRVPVRRRLAPPIPSACATRTAERTMLSAITVTVTVAPLTMSTGGRSEGAAWLSFRTSRPT
jgi:hypothetical protein